MGNNSLRSIFKNETNVLVKHRWMCMDCMTVGEFWKTAKVCANWSFEKMSKDI